MKNKSSTYTIGLDLGDRKHAVCVLVANPRKVRAIDQNVRKSDRNDAELLARLARSDEKLLCPVEHVGEEVSEVTHGPSVILLP